MKLTDRPKMEWASRGPTFNSWWTNYRALTDALLSVEGQPWWVCDTELKYLNIRLDTRDLGFIITDRDGTQIDPSRIIAAIEAFKASFTDAGRKALEQSP